MGLFNKLPSPFNKTGLLPKATRGANILSDKPLSPQLISPLLIYNPIALNNEVLVFHA